MNTDQHLSGTYARDRDRFQAHVVHAAVDGRLHGCRNRVRVAFDRVGSGSGHVFILDDVNSRIAAKETPKVTAYGSAQSGSVGTGTDNGKPAAAFRAMLRKTLAPKDVPVLIEMRLENYAVIDNLGVEFGPGLNLLTGETGAGKSILVDALALLLGD